MRGHVVAEGPGVLQGLAPSLHTATCLRGFSWFSCFSTRLAQRNEQHV